MSESITNNSMALTTPVLFLVFNRPGNTSKVFNEIKKGKPTKLYVAADGPRQNVDGESSLVEKVRSIASSVDWPCKVFTLFRKENLGCKDAVKGAIDWFFEHEEEGIILEDDCVPNNDFFFFCQEMLNRYRTDKRVMMITGTNYFSDEKYKPYFFSEIPIIWGWATWRRAWSNYDPEILEWDIPETKSFLSERYKKQFIFKYLSNLFEHLKSEKIDTWDIQWVFCCLMNRGYCVTPRKNLITNIGIDGAHANGVTKSHFMKAYNFPRSEYSEYSPLIRQNFSYDLRIYKRNFFLNLFKRSFFQIIKFFKIYKIMKYLKKHLTLG